MATPFFTPDSERTKNFTFIYVVMLRVIL